MSDKTLRQWCNDNNVRYEKGWRMFHDNEIPNAYKTAKGRILVKENSVNGSQSTLALDTNMHALATDAFKIPDFKFDYFTQAADSTTRNNKAGGTEIANRFQNIDMGVLPTSQSSNNSLNCKDMVTLCQKAYYNVAIMRQIIDLIVDLSIGKLFFRKGNKKSREFFTAYWESIGGDALQEKYYLELWRGSNVFLYPWKKELKKDDVNKIVQTYGLESTAAKKIILPAKFVFLNPADIEANGCSSFANTIYYKVLNGYELANLKSPKTEADKELLKSLPLETQQAIKKGATSIRIPLKAEDLITSFYKKIDYELFSVPVFFSTLDDINFKIEMKKQDLATLRMMNQSILLFTMGAKPDEGGINYQNINNLQALLSNSTVARYLVADYTTKGEFLTPDIGEILGKQKYEVVENDIYTGLNYVLLSGEKFANKMTALKVFLAKVRYGQNLFIRDVLKPIIANVSEQLGFKNYPEPYFEYVSIDDDTEFNRLVVRLAEIGHMTPKEVLDYFDTGKLPLWEESIENQQEFADYRDDNLYQPITGNPASQLQLTKEQNKHAMQLQDKQNEHDDKQKNKDRKFNAENPKTPAPQIVLNAPTSLKKDNGRPKGSTRPKSTNKPRVLGSQLFSETKLMDVVKKYDSLEKIVVSYLKEKHKLTELSLAQQNIATEISRLIARNEEPDNWNIEAIEPYLTKPIDKNLDRVKAIEALSAEMGLDPYLGALLYCANKTDTEANDIVE